MALLLVLWSTAATAAAAAPRSLASAPVAKPSPEQLAWQDLEVSSMLGWNLQTICRPKSQGGVTTQRCQASSKTEGALFVPTREEVADWDPSAIDTDEWVRVSASFGAKYIVMVADHMTGFTWWCPFFFFFVRHDRGPGFSGVLWIMMGIDRDTKYHNYSIAHTKYKGGGADVVKELIASCKK